MKVDAIDGTSLAVSPSMTRPHSSDTPIVRKPLGGTTTTSTTLPGNATTTTPGATTTTTTTLPPRTSSRCRVEDALAGAACDGVTIPSSLTGKIDRAIAAVDASSNQTGKQARRTRAKARKLMRAAASLAARSGRGRKPKLEPPCASALQSVLGTLAGSIAR